jgi:hypothetical protein
MRGGISEPLAVAKLSQRSGNEINVLSAYIVIGTSQSIDLVVVTIEIVVRVFVCCYSFAVHARLRPPAALRELISL